MESVNLSNEEAETSLRSQQPRHPRTSDDIPKKRGTRGKVTTDLMVKGKCRSTCLSKRRTTMFKKSLILHKKTGVDVLLIIESDRERRYFGTGKLKQDFMTGKLQSKGFKETTEESLGDTTVRPLTDTPSPAIIKPVTIIDKIVKSSTTRRSLNEPINRASLTSQIPARLMEVLTNKSFPVLLEPEQ